MLESLETIHPMLPAAAGLAALLLVAVAADQLVKHVLLRLIHSFVVRNDFSWDDVLVRHRVGARAAKVVPALIVSRGVGLVPGLSQGVATVIGNVALGYLILVIALTLSAGARAANEIYESYPLARMRPLTGFVQLLQIVIFTVAGLLIVSVLIDRSPLLLLSGFGAMTAVLMLIFKDTILGLVASIQLNAQDMVRVGDWIEMPQVRADGDIIEVGLHTVKVQNFDRTITTIPTYKLISESFKNWRGMTESGGRRIKRSVHIDQASIRFLASEDIARLEAFNALQPYLDRKRDELRRDGERLGDSAADVNRRRLTNIGTFRAYVFSYLRDHPVINENATLLVRQLAGTAQGLPLEIYCFTHTTDWIEYEAQQSDVFDHIIAIMPEFDLHVYQQPSGMDLRSMAWNSEARPE
jgi:miniconductance mechanosensitive channel